MRQFLSKKATIGATLNWIAATFIIVLIMLLFFAGVFFMGVNQSISQWLGGEGQNAGIIKGGSPKSFLVSYIPISLAGRDDFRESIAGGDEKIIKELINEEMMLKKFECYIYRISYKDKSLSSAREGLANFGGRSSSLSIQSSFLDFGESIVFYIGGKPVEIKLYGGLCKL